MIKRDYKKIVISFVLLLALNCMLLYRAYYGMHQDEKNLSKDEIIKRVWIILLINNFFLMIIVLGSLCVIFTKNSMDVNLVDNWHVPEQSNYGSVEPIN